VIGPQPIKIIEKNNPMMIGILAFGMMVDSTAPINALSPSLPSKSN
jgi:hypothetical protein